MATSTVSPDVFGAPSTTPQINRSGWASKEDWIRNQTLIGQLYRQQSLAEVMAFMEKEHNFKATYVFQTVHMTFIPADVLQREDVQNTHQAMALGQKAQRERNESNRA